MTAKQGAKATYFAIPKDKDGPNRTIALVPQASQQMKVKTRTPTPRGALHKQKKAISKMLKETNFTWIFLLRAKILHSCSLTMSNASWGKRREKCVGQKAHFWLLHSQCHETPEAWITALLQGCWVVESPWPAPAETQFEMNRQLWEGLQWAM